MSGKKKAGIKTVICSILALILVFMGVVVVSGSLGIRKEPLNTRKYSPDKISTGNIILTDDLSVIAPYMYSEADGKKIAHLLVSFPDATNTMCIASLTVTEDSEIYDFVREYIENDEAGVGTYALKGHFLVSDVRYLGEEMTAYYNNACEKYRELFEQGSGLYYNGSVCTTGFDLSYLCAEDENPQTEKSSGNLSSMIIGIVIVLAGIIGIAATVLNIVVEVMEKKKKLSDSDNEEEKQV